MYIIDYILYIDFIGSCPYIIVNALIISTASTHTHTYIYIELRKGLIILPYATPNNLGQIDSHFDQQMAAKLHTYTLLHC